jgi:hypothetical protein
LPPAIPVAVGGGNQTASLSVVYALDGTDSYDPDTFPIATYTWTVIYRPPGSTATLTGASTATPTFTPDVVGTYRFFLVVTTSDARTSEANPARADETAFANVTVETLNNGWVIPARGQRDWDSFLYEIILAMDAFLVTGTTFDCPGAVSVGDAVYIWGTNEVRRAQADSSSSGPVIGFVASKPSSTTCRVITSGPISGFVGLTAGAKYYLSHTTAGAITATPTATVGQVVQKVGIAMNSTTLFIQIDVPMVVS